MPLADALQAYFGIAKSKLSGLDQRQRFFLAAGAAGLLTVLGLLFFAARRQPQYAVAFSGLQVEDAAAIVAKLQEQGVPYRLSAGETAVLVPAEKVHEVRLQMASAGLPSSGTVGFELFDSTNLGMTEFAEQLNYRRALEGELARTISALEAVEQARVHIALPEKSVFADFEKPATASVLVKLRPGMRLTEDQILGITHLVSSSISGLSPERVTVLDTRGTVLSDGNRESPQGASSELVRAQRAYEQALEAKVLAMLSTALGPNRAVVTVHADIDWTQKETSAETYEPTAQPLVRSAYEVREAQRPQGHAPEGVPGVQSNQQLVPTYPGTAQQATAAAQGQTESNTYERSESTYNYELSKVVSRSVELPGRVRRLSVSVLLDGVQDEQQLQQLRSAVEAAVGSDAARGDSVVVESIAFDRSFYEQEEAALARQERQALLTRAGQLGAILVAAIVLLLVGRSLFLRRTVPAGGPTVTVSPAARGEARLGEARQALQLPTGEAIPLSQEQLALAESVQKHHQLITLAQRQPELIAQVLQFWLHEGSSTSRRT